jgi:hypothetical protein
MINCEMAGEASEELLNRIRAVHDDGYLSSLILTGQQTDEAEELRDDWNLRADVFVTPETARYIIHIICCHYL